MAAMEVSSASPPGFMAASSHSQHGSPSSGPSNKRKRRPAGTPDPDAEVVSLSPKTLMESDRYVCEICNQGFQRDQNLQMHRRRHKVPWKLLKRATPEVRKRVYVCPEPSCLHHDPCHALGDLVGIKKHFRRKHSTEKQWKCDKCSKGYAVQSDYKAHLKTCGTRGHCCACGRVFSRVESFIEHQDTCTVAKEKASLGDSDVSASPSSNLHFLLLGGQSTGSSGVTTATTRGGGHYPPPTFTPSSPDLHHPGSASVMSTRSLFEPSSSSRSPPPPPSHRCPEQRHELQLMPTNSDPGRVFTLPTSYNTMLANKSASLQPISNVYRFVSRPSSVLDDCLKNSTMMVPGRKCHDGDRASPGEESRLQLSIGLSTSSDDPVDTYEAKPRSPWREERLLHHQQHHHPSLGAGHGAMNAAATVGTDLRLSSPLMAEFADRGKQILLERQARGGGLMFGANELNRLVQLESAAMRGNKDNTSIHTTSNSAGFYLYNGMLLHNHHHDHRHHLDATTRQRAAAAAAEMHLWPQQRSIPQVPQGGGGGGGGGVCFPAPGGGMMMLRVNDSLLHRAGSSIQQQQQQRYQHDQMEHEERSKRHLSDLKLEQLRHEARTQLRLSTSDSSAAASSLASRGHGTDHSSDHLHGKYQIVGQAVNGDQVGESSDDHPVAQQRQAAVFGKNIMAAQSHEESNYATSVTINNNSNSNNKNRDSGSQSGTTSNSDSNSNSNASTGQVESLTAATTSL
ncbi:uncharacterized protein LOC9645956 [Selaginella moellendorffii]|nr:uncharacterized protein LOC9645956 [Selaginella moellendorffii]|eukprot:XP_002975993.2 uncharacterized protein LOC9645956 [Selaginella moellendorffii]